MTVFFSKKCELGLQAVLFLSAQEEGSAFNSVQISEKINVPRDFVSKVLQTLKTSGIVGSTKGKNGGFFLAKNASEIKLIDIVHALDGLEVFDRCVLGFEGCSVSTPCPVHDKWGKLREEAKLMLDTETLAELRDKSIAKIKSLSV